MYYLQILVHNLIYLAFYHLNAIQLYHIMSNYIF